MYLNYLAGKAKNAEGHAEHDTAQAKGYAGEAPLCTMQLALRRPFTARCTK